MVAAVALVGWWAGLPLLSSWGPGFANMKPVTAFCVTAVGLALVLPGKSSRLVFAAGLPVAIVAALDLSQALFAVEFGIDRWLVPPDAAPEPEAASFRMINGMPLALVLVGGAFALSRFEGHHFTAATLAGIAGVMAVVAPITYSTGIPSLICPPSITPPAPPSAPGGGSR